MNIIYDSVLIYERMFDMYVCLCHGISDNAIRQAIRQHNPYSLQQLCRIIPIGKSCGKCIRQTRLILEEEKEQFPECINVA